MSQLRRPSLPDAVVFGVPLVLLVTLALWCSWLCDDAYIAFRYSANFANGLGLRYNVGVEPPVEGYTQLGWVLWISIFEFLGQDPRFWSRFTGITAASLLLIWLLRFARRRLGLGPVAVLGCGLFFATSPTVAIWATGGLGTMVFALAVFAAWERLFGDPDRPRVAQAVLAALAVVVLRADGPYWLALVYGMALLCAWRTGRGTLARAVWVCGGAVTVAVGAIILFRLGYYEDWLPNTARAKVSMSATSLQRGGCYLLHYWLVIPSSLLALGFAGWAARGRDEWLARSMFVMAAGTFLYGVLVSGDFMTMGRFYLPAWPFLALAVGRFLHGLEDSSRPWLRWPWLGVLLIGSMPALFGAHVTPEAWRDAVRFRWGGRGPYASEHLFWSRSIENERTWSDLGHALARFADPGSSLVCPTIGAIGYYSDLVIYDGKGLVNRDVVREIEIDPDKLGSPSHDRTAGPRFFARWNPTYSDAKIFYAADERDQHLLEVFLEKRPGGEAFPFDAGGGISAAGTLVLWRM